MMPHPEAESLDREGMKALQARKLAALGERLGASAEWREHFARAGMHPRDLAAADGLARAPTMEKTDLRARYPFPFLTVGVSEVSRFFATSGTTGLPVLFGFTRGDLRRLTAQVARALRCGGVRPGDRVYQGFGYGLWMGGPAHEMALEEIGATCVPVGPGRAELVIEWLRDLACEVATVSPLFLSHLVRVARERGIEPKTHWGKLRLAIIGGQPISRAFREQLEAAMPPGFTARNSYGTTEAGGPNLGAACLHAHHRDEMHLINEDSVITELLDPATLRPAGPGEVGEVVVTTLDKEASPVVRWRTRDLVRMSERPYDCECGRRGMPLIGRIIGRSDDMLKVRGVIVFPSQIEDVVAGTPGTVKDAWQIYVDAIDGSPKSITVAVECEAGYAGERPALAAAVARALSSRLGLTIPVECHPHGALPRYEAKARRVLLKEQT